MSRSEDAGGVRGETGSRASVAGALVAVQFFFGLHYLAAKVLLEFVPPRAWASLRAAAAAGVLFAMVRFLGGRLPRARGDLARLALFSIFGVVINQVCFVEGLHRTTPGHSSIIMTGIPVGTLLFGVLLRREAMTSVKALSLGVSFTGVLLVVLSRPGGIEVGSLLAGGTVAGDLLTLTNALSYSLFLVLSKRLLTRTDPLGATAVLMGFGAVGILLVGGGQLVAFDPAGVPAKVWALGAYIVIFPTAIAYHLMYWALARASSYLVSLFIYLQPLIATSLSALLLGERPGPAFYAGGCLVFVGVYLALGPPERGGSGRPSRG